MINKKPFLFKGLNIRILITIRTKGRDVLIRGLHYLEPSPPALLGFDFGWPGSQNGGSHL